MTIFSSGFLSSNSYATFVVGFAIMTVLPFLPELFSGRLHVPDRQISQWTALAFEAFAVATLLSNVAVGFFADASASKSRPFLISVMIMVLSTILFFLSRSPIMLVVSRAIQGISTTFTWVTGLAFLVSQVDESELGAYVGWTTVGVAIGEIVGPLIGGPVYDYLGHWAAFGFVEALLLVDILLRVFVKEKRHEPVTDTETEQDRETDRLLRSEHEGSIEYDTIPDDVRSEGSHKAAMDTLAWNWLGTVFALIVIFAVRGALEVAVPLYLTRRYSWSATKISAALLTVTVPAALNPIVGKLTSRQGPRWWSTGAFAICGAAMLSFGSVTGNSNKSQILFIVHSTLVGIALAILVNANQVAMSVASQRYGLAKTQAQDQEEDLGRILSWLSPSTMLSGVTTSWAAGILLGPAYSSLMAYTEDVGWAIFCRGLGGVCLIASLASSFLWRKW
ncbi:MFS general substrate transporter [Tothia fuscella]|uniref:MFS general substrate transporter n=1 Tax=Tothia fuscella TaxID=1048955 RepID=A0A9P4NSV3_9PEZI|nr:MFS general substrate transporter [Tothia fuscella]